MLPALLLLAAAAPALPGSDLRLTLALDDEGTPPPPVVVTPGPPPAPPPPAYPAYPQPYPPQPASPAPVYRPSPPPAPAGDAGSRLLFGVGLHLGLGIDDFSTTPSGGGNGTGAAGVGIYLRLGAQFDDRFGAEAEIDGGTLLLLNYAQGALTFDYTPVDWFTFAVGPFSRLDDVVNLCGNGSTTAEAIGGTVRFDFHLGVSRSATGRSAATIGLAADLGATVGSNDGSGTTLGGPGLAWGLYLTVGWTRY